MGLATTIQYKEKLGNLHIYMDGRFDVETALRSASLIKRHYQGEGNVFMHTRSITDIAKNSKEMFEGLVSSLQLPRKSIYFTGPKGFLLCYNGGRVIVSKREHMQMEAERKGRGTM